MPNPVSWFAHHLPDRFHRVEVLGNHVVELAVPFLYFAPAPYAALGGAATVGFQAWLMLTGNFSWLNALTVVLAVPTFTDGVLAGLLPVAAPEAAPTPAFLSVLAAVVALLVVVRSVRPVANMLSPGQVMNTAFDPLHLVNTYGAFGSITRARYQLVVEGTDATSPTEGDWTAYAFKGQPVDPGERPPQWAPYHLRLDWQLWFAAMRPRPGGRQRWLLALVEALLSGDDDTLALLDEEPFPDDPPECVRVLRYRYRYTTPAERRETGDWWRRERVGTYLGPRSLRDFEAGAPGAPLGGY
jgi:hypothetical protein